MASKKGNSRLAKAEAAVNESVEKIDEQITELEKYLAPYEKIKGEIDKLKRARSALLGGSRLTGAGSTKIRQSDIVEWLSDHPGSTPGQIAEALHTKQNTISSALYRGKDERFLTDGDSHWWVRDPKNGINTMDDIEKEDDG